MDRWVGCELLRVLAVEAGVTIVPDPELERGLRNALDGARMTWPAIALSDNAFLSHLAGVLRRGAARTVEELLARETASDLYLACGCAAGDRAALAAFEANYLAGLDQMLARFDLPRSAIDDVKQDMRQRLLVGDGTRPPRIAEFTGVGNLRGWLRVVAINTARQILRRISAARATTSLIDAVPPAAQDVELEFLKTHYCEQFRAAFTAALAELLPQDRTLLRQHYLLGLGIGKLAAMYGVHRGTAARWLERCASALLASTRRTLVKRLQVERTDVDSILRLIRSRLEISIHSSLAAEVA